MYAKILIPVDGSAVSLSAAREGMRLAGLLGSSVEFAYVVDLSVLSLPDAEMAVVNSDAVRGSFRTHGETVLGSLTAQAANEGIKAGSQILEGDVHEEILALAEKTGAELIVMGTHGRRGLNRLVLGSVAESVARRAGCAVLLIRPGIAD